MENCYKRLSAQLVPQICNARIVKQRRTALRGVAVVTLQKHGQCLAACPDSDLSVYPDILPGLIPGMPGHGRGLPIFAASEIHAQRKLHRRFAAHVFAPGLDLVLVSRNGLGTAEYAGLGADKVERDLLRALAAFHIGRILVFIDAMCNSACPSSKLVL